MAARKTAAATRPLKEARATAPAKKARPAAPAEKAKAAAPAAGGKTRLIRDSFTIPKDEYAAIDALKARALAAGRHVRKSELLRAGLQSLTAMASRSFLKALDAVPTLKTGRPKAEAESGDAPAKKGAGRRKAA